MATHIQACMLPCIFPAFPERFEFDIYASMQPAKEVGGDFYDFILIDEDHLAIFFADVSGKGFRQRSDFVLAGKEDIERYPLQAGKNSLMVFGRFFCYTGQNADKVVAANQRVTIHFRKYGKNKGTKMTHLHVSNEWNELVNAEVFPVRVSEQTYRYVQKLVAESGVKKRHKKIELRNDSGLQYIDTDMVVYEEAIGKHTVVHFVDKSVTIKRIIGEAAPLFPKNFCRPHRGYLVNSEYIFSVKRYNITKVTGMTIPIPKKRYSQVREEIAGIMNI